jgi:hypothetical protein
MVKAQHEFEKGNSVMVKGDKRDGQVYKILLVSPIGDGQCDILLEGMIAVVSPDMLIPA